MKTWEYLAVGCEGQNIYGCVEATTEEEAKRLVSEAMDETHAVLWVAEALP